MGPTLRLDSLCAGARVIDHDPLDAIVFGVMLIQHGIRDVWNIVTSVTLASNVDLFVVQGKGIKEIFEESQKLFSNIVFVLS